MTVRMVVMGVSGCGKSSLGALLSERLAIPFVEGDQLHPPANVDKMRRGIPLDDADRLPWLERVAKTLAQPPVIVSCSALKLAYRDRIRAGVSGPLVFIYLAGNRDLIATRLAERRGHYMPTSLLDSQFAALEPAAPGEAIEVSISTTIEMMANFVLKRLHNESNVSRACLFKGLDTCEDTDG